MTELRRNIMGLIIVGILIILIYSLFYYLNKLVCDLFHDTKKLFKRPVQSTKPEKLYWLTALALELSRKPSVIPVMPLLANTSQDALTAALAALDQHNYDTAAELWRPLANQGNADAQYNLGIMYENGNGVPQDYAEAVTWFRKAADQGNTKAQYGLGVMYENGNGVPQDYAEAVKWFRKAAEQGDANAQYNLGVVYYNGQGVPQDFVEAHKWYNLAAARAIWPHCGASIRRSRT